MFNTSKIFLQYSLIPLENGVKLEVIQQAPEVYAFLSKYNFMASNGLRIAMDKYPEYKYSKNVIFLRGRDVANNNKEDITRFVGRMQRDNAIAMFDQALSEFISAVKKWASTSYIGYPGAVQVPVVITGGNQFVVSQFSYKVPKVDFFKPVNIQKVYIY